MSINVIGDIAGQYDTLMDLLDIMPDCRPVSVGDMIDRGPDSNLVLEFFRKHGDAVLGNHEHLMLDWIFSRGIYDRGVWFMNGGEETVKSYSPDNTIGKNKKDSMQHINKKDIAYLQNLPLKLEFNLNNTQFLITHAPVNPVFGLDKAMKQVEDSCGGGNSVIWNRGKTKAMAGIDLQVFGHNASKSVKWFGKGTPHSVCIDTSHAEILTGIHLPSMDIYQVPFRKNKE